MTFGKRTLVASAAAIMSLGLVVAPTTALMGGGFANFLGAGEGTQISFTHLELPSVVGSSEDDVLTRNGFLPMFDDLVTGETTITNEDQLAYVWRRLFNEDVDSDLVDFDDSFVVFAGGGTGMNTIGFSISGVERFDAEFDSFVAGSIMEPGLAITITTFFPGVAPKDPQQTIFVDAVVIPRIYLDDIIFHRNAIFAP